MTVEPRPAEISDSVAADLRLILEQRVLHCHMRDGHWDADGRPCQECAARGRLYAALGDPCIECGEPFEAGDPVTLRARWTPVGPIHADVCIWDDPPTQERAVCTPLSESTAPETGWVEPVSPVAGAATPATRPSTPAPCPRTPGVDGPPAAPDTAEEAP